MREENGERREGGRGGYESGERRGGGKEEGREEWAWERGGKEKEKGRERREKGKVQGDSEGGKQRKDEREGRVTIFFPAAYLVFTVPATTSVQL